MWLKALVFTNKVKLPYISLRYLRNQKNLVISQSKKFTINKVAGLQFAALLVLESLFNKAAGLRPPVAASMSNGLQRRI